MRIFLLMNSFHITAAVNFLIQAMLLEVFPFHLDVVVVVICVLITIINFTDVFLNFEKKKKKISSKPCVGFYRTIPR